MSTDLRVGQDWHEELKIIYNDDPDPERPAKDWDHSR